MNYEATRHAIEDSPATGAAWAVLVVIAYHADRRTGECYASRRRLATKARISTSTLHHALRQLLAAGQIEIVVGGTGRRSTSYRVAVPGGAAAAAELVALRRQTIHAVHDGTGRGRAR